MLIHEHEDFVIGFDDIGVVCHNRTLMAVDLRLCGTHFSATSELSLFVLASPTAKRRMLEPLVPVQEESS